MQEERMKSIYIHIPFCEVKCGYCDFFSVPRGFEDFDLQSEYVEALIREIDQRCANLSKKSVKTIFFGGGTPSLLDPELLEKILKTLSHYFSWTEKTEMTLESNPKTVSFEKFRQFKDLGFNRVSIGVQSFQDPFLKVLGRIHDGQDAIRAVDDARRAQFENVNVDLIFALPNQSFEDWKQDLHQAIELKTEHLSAYHLTIENGTPFAGVYRSGQAPLPDDEEGVKFLTWTRETLEKAGLSAYEISNFARSGRECFHNQNYWQYGEYLGFGAGAVSFERSKDNSIFGTRRHNIRSLKKYLEDQPLDFEDKIDRTTAMGEFCMLGLRTREGISCSSFQDQFGLALENIYTSQLNKWCQRGLLKSYENHYGLTHEGIILADEIAVSFL